MKGKKNVGEGLPADVDVSRKEFHLSEDEFFKLFKMRKDVYVKKPRWKQDQMKQSKEINLYGGYKKR